MSDHAPIIAIVDPDKYLLATHHITGCLCDWTVPAGVDPDVAYSRHAADAGVCGATNARTIDAAVIRIRRVIDALTGAQRVDVFKILALHYRNDK